jgi:hypothetical protein
LDYVKPFRTIEDIHVFAAVLGFLFRIGTQFNWPQPIQSQTLSHLLTVRTLSQQPFLAPETHIALGGLLDQLHQFIERLESHWTSVDESIQKMWQRDRALLNIANSVRVKRLDTAWRQFQN